MGAAHLASYWIPVLPPPIITTKTVSKHCQVSPGVGEGSLTPIDLRTTTTTTKKYNPPSGHSHRRVITIFRLQVRERTPLFKEKGNYLRIHYRQLSYEPKLHIKYGKKKKEAASHKTNTNDLFFTIMCLRVDLFSFVLCKVQISEHFQLEDSCLPSIP